MYLYINGAEALRVAVENGSRTRVRTADKRPHRRFGGKFAFKMSLVLVLVVALVGTVSGQTPGRVVKPTPIDSADNCLADTELILAFVIFRHGDRTPDQEEMALYPSEQTLTDEIFFPYGKKALTNKGKRRAYLVGKYLRQLYDGFINKLYLPDEITVRTTDYARTQMTALTALSALYPPPPAQKWNPNLDWQPIPYNTPPYDEDDLLYWYNCPRYLWLRDKVYDDPQVKKWIEPYGSLFSLMSEKTGTNITKPEDVFFLDNLFQTLENVGVTAPPWAQEVMTKVKDCTKIEYGIEFYNSELIKLSAGVLMQSILNITNAAIHNTSVPIEPKLHLYSGHENNVAALMAAARVYEAHQPNYGATFSLELRRNNATNEYGITAVYAADAGGPGKILPISGCGDQLVCPYDQFVSLVQEVCWTKEEMDRQCKNLNEL